MTTTFRIEASPLRQILALALLLAACGDGQRAPKAVNPDSVAAASADSGAHAPAPTAITTRPVSPDTVIARFLRGVPDSAFVRRGACPFECCMYREWTAESAIVLRTQPRDSALAGFTLAPGTTFQADSGNVYVTSAQLVAVKDSVGDAHYWSFAPGDTLLVLDYTGEGYYQVWHDGKSKPAQIFWGGGSTAADTIGTWKTEWWVHATQAGGPSGWFIADNHNRFDNADACGG